MTDAVRYIDVDVVGGAGDGTSWPNAYSSMAAWNAAEATDLVAAGDTHTVYCRASLNSPDTTKLVIDGWVTGAGNELTIIVLPEDRHDGTRGTGYRLIASSGFDETLDIREDYVSVIGLAASSTSTSAAISTIAINLVGTGIRIFDSCLVYDSPGHGIHINDTSATAFIINCIVLSSGQHSGGGVGIAVESNGYVYNCVSVNNNTGTTYTGYGLWQDGFGTVYAKNCYCGGNDGDDYNQHNGTLNLTTCHSEDATGNVQTAFSASAGAYFTNVTSGSEDIHITSSSDLIDVGTDLHEDASYPFNVDAWNTARPNGAWDVGAHEYVSVAPPVTGQPNKAAFFARCF